MNVYETRSGNKKQDIYFTRNDKPDPKEIHFDIDDNNLFRCVAASTSAGYVVSCVSGTSYNSGKYEQCCWLVCHDLTTFEFLASEISYYYMKMSISEVRYCLFFTQHLWYPIHRFTFYENIRVRILTTVNHRANFSPFRVSHQQIQ